MQAQAYEGYFENGSFYTAGRTMNLPERKRVFIMVLNEPEQYDIASHNVSQRLKVLEELNAMVDASADEEVPIFERVRLRREVNL